MLNDTTGGNSGVNRFQWDVLSNSNVKYVIVWEGLKDIENAVTHDPVDLANGKIAARLEGAYQQLIDVAHSNGLKIIGATLQPAGYPKGSAQETTREDVNNWIRAAGLFDNFTDFDVVLRKDANDDNVMNPSLQYNHGIHPNDQGYLDIANALAHEMGWVG